MTIDLFYGLLPEHLLLALLLVLMLLEIFGADRRVAAVLFNLTLACSCAVLLLQLSQGYAAVVVTGEIAVDPFSILARLVILGCALLLGVCFQATATMKFWMLLCSSLLGAMIIMDSAGFISLFIGIEMLSLPVFALMVLGCGASRASEGAFKYLLLSSVASGLILFGISLSYGCTDSLNIAAFSTALQAGGPQILAASVLILCGFFLKAAVFPFHGWAPDAYAGARLPVTVFMASVIKATVVLALVRILSTQPLNDTVVTAIAVLSVCSIFYGNVTAIGQTAFKRLLAYSSIAHAGYMIFALCDNTGGRLDALFYYVAVYAVTTVVACVCFSLLVGGKDDTLESLDGAFAVRPVPAVLLALAALSLAGIPPFPGFIAKFFIFKSVIASGYLLPAVVAFVGSYVGVIYYLGIVLRLFKPEAASSFAAGPNHCRWSWGGMLLGTLVLLLFMLAPGVFHDLLTMV